MGLTCSWAYTLYTVQVATKEDLLNFHSGISEKVYSATLRYGEVDQQRRVFEGIGPESPAFLVTSSTLGQRVRIISGAISSRELVFFVVAVTLV